MIIFYCLEVKANWKLSTSILQLGYARVSSNADIVSMYPASLMSETVLN